MVRSVVRIVARQAFRRRLTRYRSRKFALMVISIGTPQRGQGSPSPGTTRVRSRWRFFLLMCSLIMRAALTCLDTSRRPTAFAAPQSPTLRREQRAGLRPRRGPHLVIGLGRSHLAFLRQKAVFVSQAPRVLFDVDQRRRLRSCGGIMVRAFPANDAAYLQ